jgi:hypothetical protein
VGTPAEWQGKAMFEWHRRKQSAGGIARRPQYTIELTYEYTVEIYIRIRIRLRAARMRTRRAAPAFAVARFAGR